MVKLITCCFVLTAKNRLLVKHLKVIILVVLVLLSFFPPPTPLCLELLGDIKQILWRSVF